MILTAILVVAFLAVLVGVRRFTRPRPEVLVISPNRELAAKAPAQTSMPTIVLPTINDDMGVALAQRTDTVMFHAIKPDDYPWARA